MQSENKQVLENKYWGFKVKYPEEWISWESETGSRYYIENYDGRDMDVWYVPTQDQLRVRISIIDRDMGQDYIGVSTDLMTENIQGPLMGGVQSKKVVWKGDLSGYEKASHQRNGYPQSHIDRGHHMIQYIVLNNGFTYILSAEPADSILVNKFEEIVSSFEFIERGPIYEEFQGEFPENVSVH